MESKLPVIKNDWIRVFSFDPKIRYFRIIAIIFKFAGEYNF